MPQTFEYQGLKYEIANPEEVDEFFDHLRGTRSNYPTAWVILLGTGSPTRIVVWGRHLTAALNAAAGYAMERGYEGLVVEQGSAGERALEDDARRAHELDGTIDEDTWEEEAQELIFDQMNNDYVSVDSGWIIDDWHYEEHTPELVRRGVTTLDPSPFYLAAVLNSADAELHANRQGHAKESYCDGVLNGERGSWWEAPFCMWGSDAAEAGYWHVALVDLQDAAEFLDDQPLSQDVWWLVEEEGVAHAFPVGKAPPGGGKLDYVAIIAKAGSLRELLVLQDAALARGEGWSVDTFWPPNDIAVVRDEDGTGYLATSEHAATLGPPASTSNPARYQELRRKLMR